MLLPLIYLLVQYHYQVMRKVPDEEIENVELDNSIGSLRVVSEAIYLRIEALESALLARACDTFG